MRLLFSILFYLNVCFLGLSLKTHDAYANNSLPEDIKIPPAFELRNNLWLPSVNQFVIIPLTGQIAVYYVGIFSNTDPIEQKQKNFILPLPKGAQLSPIVPITLKSGVQQIQQTFLLDAPYGSFEWKAGQFNSLPGVTVIALKDTSAKISMQSADFIHDTSDATFIGEQYVRVSWNNDTPYPRFSLTHVIPSRRFTYLGIGILGLMLFSGLLIFVKIKGSRMT